jgi:enoyl-CoA hydratase/carnithine racemase
VVGVRLDAREYADAMRDPLAGERFSAVAGVPLVVVDVPDRSAGLLLRGVESPPAVVVLLAPDPAAVTGPRAADTVLGDTVLGDTVLGDTVLADIVLTDDPLAPWVAPPGGIRRGLAEIDEQVAANPIAAGALAALLRSSAGLPVAAGLVAESATYSLLQAGPEFARWRAGRPVRAPEADRARVRVERDGDRLHLTLVRPARRNALDTLMRDALSEALALAAADPGLTVLLDADGPDFCAGGDLDEFGARPDPATAHLTRLTRSPARLLHAVRMRATVRVHGACLGAGAELPAFGHRVEATETARFGLPELSLGLVPGAGGTVSLPRRIGRHRTAWLALSGQHIDAHQALDWGLVDHLVAGPSP